MEVCRRRLCLLMWTWLLAVLVGSTYSLQDYSDRSHHDWARVWTVESMRQCHEDLREMVHISCHNDPRKITSKRSIFIPRNEATGFLSRFLRTRRPSELHEDCCLDSRGCTWEEVAEIACINNRRRMHRPGSPVGR
ncbi:insulin-like peptide 7 [Antedon mediterranea]|uniref:insulin-like peptide 7 n=1 Tax=Antedon mediterranea TaxID=105859 RepID=UPI003AF6A71A